MSALSTCGKFQSYLIKPNLYSITMVSGCSKTIITMVAAKSPERALRKFKKSSGFGVGLLSLQ